MWKNININKNQIKTETEKSALIKMPHSSNYDGYCFWHPQKLIRIGKNSSALKLGYNDEFIFRLIKYGNGKHNKYKIIDEEEIDVEEFESAFEITSNNIPASKSKNDYETYKPKKLEAEDVSVLDELKDEE